MKIQAESKSPIHPTSKQIQKNTCKFKINAYLCTTFKKDGRVAQLDRATAF